MTRPNKQILQKAIMKSNKSSAPVGASLVVLSSVFYASYGIWTKLMGNFFDGYVASALRSVLVIIILLPIALLHHKLEPVIAKKNWRYIFGMFAASLFTWGPLYYAILHAGVGISLTISYASIVLGMFFFGWLFANEKFTKEKALSACLGLAGLGLIFTPNIASLGLVALGAAFISGLSVSATMVSSKLIKYNPTMTTIVLWTTSVAANFVMALFFSNAHPTFGVHKEWLYLLLFSAASIIASWSLIRGLKLIDAGTAGVLGLLEIVFGVLFGIIFFNESLGGLTILGIVVIITAAAIPYISEYKSN